MGLSLSLTVTVPDQPSVLHSNASEVLCTPRTLVVVKRKRHSDTSHDGARRYPAIFQSGRILSAQCCGVERS